MYNAPNAVSKTYVARRICDPQNTSDALRKCSVLQQQSRVCVACLGIQLDWASDGRCLYWFVDLYLSFLANFEGSRVKSEARYR